MSAPAAASLVDDPGRLKRRTLGLTSLGYFIVILDTTAKNVALPRIGADLHANVADLQWVINSYLLVFASLLLTAGALSDRYGARRLFAVGMAVFGVASLLSAIARDPGQLIAAQLLAGVGAALVTPASLALLAMTFTDPRERGRAIGTWATVAGVGMAGGPLLGGLLVSLFDWQGVFLVNLPVAIAGVGLLRRWLPPEAAPNRSRSVDLPGQLLAIAALALLTYGLITGGEAGWSTPGVLAALGAALLALMVFLAVESRVATPMFPLRLLRSVRFSSSVLAGATINFGTYSQMFLLALYFQTARGYDALGTGTAELPMTVMCVLLPTPAGRAVARFGPRVPLALGLASCGAGALCLTWLSVDSPYPLAVPGLVMIGVGMALSIPAVSAAAMTGVERTDSGIASGVLNTSRHVGGVVGVALLGGIVAAGIGQRLPVALTVTAIVQLAGGLIAWRGLRGVRS